MVIFDRGVSEERESKVLSKVEKTNKDDTNVVTKIQNISIIKFKYAKK